MAQVEAVIARKASQEQTAEWLDKQGITADADGTFTAMPYGDEPPVPNPQILENVALNAKRHDVPNLRPREFTSKILVYVGGGPTLKSHLEEVKAKCLDDRYDVFCSNKTASYLVQNGIIPNFHIIIDPQERKVKDLSYAADIDLILGLQCHPALFDKALEMGKRVHKFLAASVTHEGVADSDLAIQACHDKDNEIMGIGGGSMCGTRMFYFAAARGHRRIEYYGFDGHVEMKNGVVNCYSYFKPRGENILETTAANGRVFNTTLGLLRQAEEIVELMDILPGMDVEIYGDSLLSNQLALYKQQRPQLPVRATDAYIAMQRGIHESGEKYGFSGKIHAPRVFMAAAQIARKVGQCRVLDYGSGPGGLAEAIKSAFADVPGIEYVDYDPAYPGKDADPSPAELVFCGDVLEHVEIECTDAVIRHLAKLTKSVLIVVIALQPAKRVLPDGRNAHICLQKPDWWLSKLRRHFVIVERETTSNYLLATMVPIP